jgi:hypothetical protein
MPQEVSSDTFYYLTDGLGPTMALTDESGEVDTSWDYDVFGAVRGTTGSQPTTLPSPASRWTAAQGCSTSTCGFN